MRELLIEKMYEISKKPYQKMFKKQKAWDIDIPKLIVMPQETLGFQLGCFLLKYNFEIQPKLEDHDIIHVLTNTGISVVDEIGMQYYLFGNGKKSSYMFAVIIIGTLFYLSKTKHFKNQFQRGRQAHQFYNLDFQKMLTIPIQTIQESFNIK
jgi:ubiquinone biosynthesis protein Coq4